MLELAAFADEISPDLNEQVRVCHENGVRHIELRGVNKLNVMDFDQSLCKQIKSKVHEAGMQILSIASPIGKAKISDPWPAYFDKFKHAVDLAHLFGAQMIRIFSYYPPQEGGDIREHRDEVMRRMSAKADYLRDMPLILVHENEKGIYGEHGTDCENLLKSVNSPKLRAAFDFANFVEVGDKPLDNWQILKPYVAHIHVKDYKKTTHQVVPAGQGDGDVESILVNAWQSGYKGFLSLEPHLKVAGHSHGETGPELFKVAADALKYICRKNAIALAAAA